MTRSRRLAFALLAVAMILLLAEGAARLLPAPSAGRSAQGEALSFARNPELQQGNARFWAPDPLYFWRMRPHLEEDFGGMDLRTNAGGFRDGPHQRQAGRPLIAVLGDSTTFGWGILDEQARYGNRLQENLAASGRPAQVFNFGQSGYSTEQGRRLLEREVLPLEPAAVVLLFGPNDYAEASGRRDADQPVAAAGGAGARTRSALQHSAFYRQLAAVLVRLRDRPHGRDGNHPDAADILRRVPPERFRANLEDMVQAVRAAGARPVLVTYPRRPLNPLLPCPVPALAETDAVQRWNATLRHTATPLQAAVSAILARQAGSPEEALQGWQQLPAALHDSPSFIYGTAWLMQQAGRSGEAEKLLASISRQPAAADCAPDLFSTRLFRYLEEPAAAHYNDLIRTVSREQGTALVDAAALLAEAQEALATAAAGRRSSGTRTLSRWYGSASYFVDVVHPSPRGHALLAEALQPHLDAVNRR